MKRLIGVLLMIGSAAMIISAIAATGAQAVGGPLWIVGNPGRSLEAGEEREIASESEGALTLHSTVASIICNKAPDTGNLYGGNPGTDYSRIKFEECHVEGLPNCSATGLKPLAAANAGEVLVDVLTVLVYPDEEAEGNSALDAFAPEGEEGNPNLFVEFELKNLPGTTECALLNKQKVRVEAKGTTLIDQGHERKCGQLAEVGYANPKGEFILSMPGEVDETGLLRLKETPITKAERWNGTAFELIECKLEAGVLGVVNEVGKDQIKISGPAGHAGEEFGWDK